MSQAVLEKIVAGNKNQKDVETQYLIGEITSKYVRSMLSNTVIQACQTRAEIRKLFMVTLFILELSHDINKNSHFRQKCISFLLTCEDELTLLHMLTTRSRVFTEQEIIILALRIVKFGSAETIGACVRNSGEIPENIKIAMSSFA